MSGLEICNNYFNSFLRLRPSEMKEATPIERVWAILALCSAPIVVIPIGFGIAKLVFTHLKSRSEQNRTTALANDLALSTLPLEDSGIGRAQETMRTPNQNTEIAKASTIGAELTEAAAVESSLYTKNPILIRQVVAALKVYSSDGGNLDVQVFLDEANSTAPKTVREIFEEASSGDTVFFTLISEINGKNPINSEIRLRSAMEIAYQYMSRALKPK